jgi:hypothetical protein
MMRDDAIAISDDGRFAARCTMIEDEHGRESILLSACDIEDIDLLHEDADLKIVSDYQKDITERHMLDNPVGNA